MPPRGVKVGNGQHLTVTWAGDWCLKREKVFVQKYVVHYCKVSACTGMLNDKLGNKAMFCFTFSYALNRL